MAYETVADIIAERDRLKKALSFYADSTRYHGPNQRLDEPDEWSDAVGLTAYRLDVTRDGGMIARQALDQHNFVVDAESTDMAVRPADNMAHSWRKKSLTS